MSAKAKDAAHARHLKNDGVDVPGWVHADLMSTLDDVATHANRGELMEAISAVYAVVGKWEEFLEDAGDA